ncbi:TolC family protein [Candidatus Riflebacteria bacterium]
MRFLVLLSLIFFGQHLAAEKFTLDPILVLRLAYENNRDLKIARTGLKKAIARVEKAAVDFGLRLDFLSNLSSADMPSYYLGKTVDQREMQFNTVDLNNPGTHAHTETGIGFSFPLYLGGLKKLSRKMAQQGKDISLQTKEALTNQVLSTAISLYYQYRIALEQEETERKSLERIRAHLSEIQVKFTGGSVLKTDVLSMKVRVEETRLRLVSAANLVHISKATLLTFLGLDLETEIVIGNKDWELPDLPGTFVNARAEALKNRKELSVARLGVKMGETGIGLSQVDRKWKINFFGNYKYNSKDFSLSQDRDNWMTGVQISKNIFDNNLSRRKKSVALMAKKEALDRQEKVLSRIELDVKRAVESRKHAAEALKVSRSNLKLAKENLDLMKQQYEGGSITVTALLDVDQAYANALSGQVLAKYRDLIARAELRRATGQWLACISKFTGKTGFQGMK